MEKEQIIESGKSFFKISGVALKATTSLNGNTYTVDDLKNNDGKSVKLFAGDEHIANTDNVVGNVTFTFDESDEVLRYSGKVRNTDRHTDIVDKALDGFLAVSIGAMPTENSIDIRHLALVASPGVPDANIESMMAESFSCEIVEGTTTEEIQITENEATTMEKDFQETILNEIKDIKESIAKLSESNVNEAEVIETEDIVEAEKIEDKKEDKPKEDDKSEEEMSEEGSKKKAKKKADEPIEEEKEAKEAEQIDKEETVQESIAPVEQVAEEIKESSVIKNVFGQYEISESFYNKNLKQ